MEKFSNSAMFTRDASVEQWCGCLPTFVINKNMKNEETLC
jgi:hypothetical protein